ncbi:hypothetical protein ASF25_17385 [Methylobacterium sp. Leaf100]|nr:hypothetical protein ASF25_17385 [Methylobacterium sp. Leaf100]
MPGAGRADLVGGAALYVPEAPKLRHQRHFVGGASWGVFVSADARGVCVGMPLIAAVTAYAETCVDDVGLSVEAANHGAIRPYEAAGFVPYGIELRALNIADVFYDEILMNLDLSRQG